MRARSLAVLSLSSAIAHAGTLVVPNQYATIQAAIEAAHAGDTIVVRPGSYAEAIVLPAFDLSLSAPGGAAATTIDATGLDASVVSVSGAGNYSTVIDGFTITGGEGTELPPGYRWGGGVYATSSGVTLRHCRITHNGMSTGHFAGGGVLGPARLEDCEVSDNMADDGGGVDASEWNPATLVNCTVTRNSATRGGGLFGGCVLIDGMISGNSAESGGGLYTSYLTSKRWERVTFDGNTAETGGGCCINGVSSYQFGAFTVRHTTFLGNVAVNGSAVSIYDDGDDPLIPRVVDCMFMGNASASGHPSIDASSYWYSGNLSLENSTVLGESALPEAPNISFVTVKASILWNLPGPVDPEITVQFSDVEGGHRGIGNISADPQFVDLAAKDVHIRPTSPCRNTGGAKNPAAIEDTDIDGDPRGLEGFVDMGSDEFANDCDGNGVLDWQDLLAGTSIDCDQNGLPDECEPFVDCNGNGVRDGCDIASGTSTDCDHDGVPDECESPADCNGNGVPDLCDIASGSSTDCNHDRVPDECENLPDCNGNGIPDACDLESGFSLDCNGNGIPDTCDIASGLSRDANGDGVADECQNVIHVPTDKPTLLEAVQAASPLDIIVVEPGVHAGWGFHHVLLAKPLTIMGATTASECVIDAQGADRIIDVLDQAGHVTLRNLTLRGGAGASASGAGGAVRVTGGDSLVHLSVRDCNLVDNDSQKKKGGAMAVRQGATAELKACLFGGNSAGDGGAVAVVGAGSSATITQCTFFGNAALGGDLGPAYGGALELSAGGSATLRDCIFVGDSADNGPEIAVHGAGTSAQVGWCDVAGGEAGVALASGDTLLWGAGNIDADPLFKDAAAADFHLAGGSPCIDSGDPSEAPDADGTPPDMGARPFQPFTDLGHALAGALGAPQLTGHGTGTPGEVIVLQLDAAAPRAPATLVLGGLLVLAPFKGGVMAPLPGLLIAPLAVGADGTLRLSGRLPADAPAGFTIIVQVWIADASGPVGFAASNGVEIEVR